jgi:hypothetical protein
MPSESERVHHIRRHYQGLDDETLLKDLSHGQAGYATSEVWQIIVSEAQRRGLEAPPVGSHDALITGSDGKTTAFSDRIESGNSTEPGTRYAIVAHPDGRVRAVKQGFCWPAFFFTGIWAFIKGLPVLAIEIVVVLGTIGIVGRLLTGTIFLPLLAGVPVRYVLGVKGNRMRQETLLSEGFRLVGTVVASAPKEALAKAHAPTERPETIR